MQKTTFASFIGKNYSSGGMFNKKILVLGESHYCSESEVCSDLTAKVLQSYLNAAASEPWMNTFKKFERALAGKATSQEDSRKIWNSVAFYNYLQVPMGDARIAGTPKDYADAVEPFFGVLEDLQPDVIIVWGKRLWENTPAQNWEPLPPCVMDDYKNPQGYYKLSGGKKIFTTAVYHHPSTSFDWEYCHKVFVQMGIVR